MVTLESTKATVGLNHNLADSAYSAFALTLFTACSMILTYSRVMWNSAVYRYNNNIIIREYGAWQRRRHDIESMKLAYVYM